MQGLLRHSASIWSGLGGLPYPTEGLDVIVYNSTYEDGGTTYYRTSKGIGLPVISGTGLDTIIDFAPLNDVRFDKGSYVGNAFGLPATYNFPYVGIYYDATSEATRYHWKITDFGYAVILAQSLLVDNMFFLKAKATTNTSNVIATWDKLFIYTTALADNNLAKMKTYIGIQNTFYVNLYTSDFSIDSDDWLISFYDTGSFNVSDNKLLINSTGNQSSARPFIRRLNTVSIGDVIRFTLKGESGIIYGNNLFGAVYAENPQPDILNVDYIKEGVIINSTGEQCYIYFNGAEEQNIIITEIIVDYVYENYYKS